MPIEIIVIASNARTASAPEISPECSRNAISVSRMALGVQSLRAVNKWVRTCWRTNSELSEECRQPEAVIGRRLWLDWDAMVFHRKTWKQYMRPINGGALEVTRLWAWSAPACMPERSDQHLQVPWAWSECNCILCIYVFLAYFFLYLFIVQQHTNYLEQTENSDILSIKYTILYNIRLLCWICLDLFSVSGLLKSCLGVIYRIL